MRKISVLLLTVVLGATMSLAQATKKSTDQKGSKSTTAASSMPDNNNKATSGKTAPAGKMDINTASKDDLEKLPGIGPATSQKIVDGRPYKTKRELLTKKVVSQSEYDKIKDNIIAHQDAGAATSEKSDTSKSATTTTKASSKKKK
jgi:competence protein ComEA